ncbi:Uncharacterised protein [Yersinia thracica]|uniref:Uncharacterized protein n=1 Tax=Yersinia thracica TaxID=2890319 RepID=A0A0T9QVB0_9GAMM|nr:Uncharacterised protein [Yersinia thracica]
MKIAEAVELESFLKGYIESYRETALGLYWPKVLIALW